MDGVVRSICLLGLPGAGKTSLAHALAEAFTWRVVSIGEALRRLAQNETALAAQLATGALAPEDVVTRIVEDAAQDPTAEPLVIDGFPRHADQVAEADRVLQNWVPLLLDVDQLTASRRLVGRAQCPACGLVAQATDSFSERCSRCKALRPARRDEDSPDVIARRLAESLTRLETLVRTISAQGRLLLRVDGRDMPANVLRQAAALLSSDL